MNKNAAVNAGGRKSTICKDNKLVIVFAILSFAVLCGKKVSALFLLLNFFFFCVCVSKATGVFGYSGQEVKNTLPHLLYSFAHVFISSPST